MFACSLSWWGVLCFLVSAFVLGFGWTAGCKIASRIFK